MQATHEIRQKLVLVIGSLICRCIEEARKIPYILDQEQVVEILVRDPIFFSKLVREEHSDNTEFSTDRLTAKIDATIELGQFEALDAIDVSFSAGSDTDAAIDQIREQINRLTRTFVVYTGNMVTIFEKEFQLFMEKFRQSLQKAGMVPRASSFDRHDMQGLEQRAEQYLLAGQFLQAFSCDRLLNSQVITKELVNLPPGYLLSRSLVQKALKNPALFSDLVKFILRACYISQGSWQDLFATLVYIVAQEPERVGRSVLIDRIEQDGIFCCNLLCESFSNLKKRSVAERRAAIEARLQGWGDNPSNS